MRYYVTFPITDACPHSNLHCYHGGYEDPNNCGVCKCPAGISTPDCDTAVSLQDAPHYQNYFNKGRKY